MKFVLFFVLILIETTVFATIKTSPIFLDFTDSMPRIQNIFLTNTDDKIAYVSVTAGNVIRPGKKNEKVNVVKNPKKLGLLVSPQKLIIPPKQTRIVRVVRLIKPDNIEHLYRVMAEQLSSTKYYSKEIKRRSVSLSISFSYDINVFVAPKVPNTKVDIKRQGKKVKIHNDGNVLFKIFGVKQCDVHYKNCKLLDKLIKVNVLYPGDTLNLNLPKAQPITFKKKYFDKVSIEKSN